MRQTILVLWLLCVPLYSSVTSAQSSVDTGQKVSTLYSEVSTDNRIKDTVYYAKLTTDLVKILPWTFAYVGFGYNQDALSDETSVYNDNYVAPLAGARFKKASWPWALFTEYRWVSIPAGAGRPSFFTNEARAGFLVSEITRFLKLGGTGLALFNDFYGEAVFSSRLENNLFLSSNDKIGLERTWWRHLVSQLYIEGAAKRDRLGYYYENLQELRAGIRQKWTIDPLTVGFSVHYAAGSYTDRQYRDPNPYGPYYSEWKALFVFGGQL